MTPVKKKTVLHVQSQKYARLAEAPKGAKTLGNTRTLGRREDGHGMATMMTTMTMQTKTSF